MTRIIPALALVGLLAACGGGDKPDEPIQTAGIPLLVTLMCSETPTQVQNRLDRMTDDRRAALVLDVMVQVCPGQAALVH